MIIGWSENLSRVLNLEINLVNITDKAWKTFDSIH